MKISVTLLVTLLVGGLSSHNSKADVFFVSDSDFVNGVYEFRYYSQSNLAFVNGNQISYSSLVLTNSGVQGPVVEGASKYWQATGTFSATQLSGAITMGWDFSGVSLDLGQVGILSNSAVFQITPWVPHALGDKVFGEIATPTSFGSSSYNRYFEFEGDGLNNGGYSNVGQIQDVSSLLSSSWLDNPNLFELRLGYQQHAIDSLHPNIPGKHIQFFRDSAGFGDCSFLLRVTAVPEPTSCLPMASALVGLVTRRRRVRAIFQDGTHI